MRKKMMLVAALAGILTLGACVDDNESASVVDIRKAKAKQLEAMAEMYKANGEADLIRANAEKALKEAEAEYQKALTAGKLDEIEQAKQRFAEEIRRIQAETENALLQAQIDKAGLEKDLLSTEDDRLNELYNIYSRGAGLLAGLNDDLLGEIISLKQVEAGLISATAFANQQTVNQNNIIARETAKRDALKALPANNKAALEAEIEKYEAELLPVKAEKAVKNDALTKANKSYNDALPNFEISTLNPTVEVVVAAKKIRNDYNLAAVTSENVKLTDLKSISYYSLVQAEVTRERNNRTSTIEGLKQTIGKVAIGADPATGMYAALKVLQDARDQAKIDYDAAKISGSYSEAQIESLRYAWQSAIASVEAQERNIQDNKEDQLKEETELAEFNTLVQVFTDKKADYDTAVNDLKALAVAQEKAADELKTVTDKETDLNFLLTAVKALELGTADLPSLIAAAEANIAVAQDDLAAIVDIDNAEKAIVVVKEKITILQAKIAAQKIIVDKAKAALDAALNA